MTTTTPTPSPIAARSGVYTYSRNGAPSEIVETWQLTHLPRGGVQIAAQRRAPALGIQITVEAEAEAGGPGALFGAVRRFSAAWQRLGAGTHPVVHAAYVLTEAGYRVRRTLFGAAPEETHHTVAGSVIFSPLMRVFQGPVIRQVAEMGGGAPVPVVVPWIMDAQDNARLLTPHIDPRAARRLGACTIPVAWSPTPLPAERYTYQGDRYDETAEFDLDAEAVLLRYSFRESAVLTWEVRLSTYVCSR